MPCRTSGLSPYRWRTPRTAIPSAGRPGETSGRPSDTGAPRVTPTTQGAHRVEQPDEEEGRRGRGPDIGVPGVDQGPGHEEDRAQTGELGDVEPPVEAGGRAGRPELVRHRRRGCLLRAGVPARSEAQGAQGGERAERCRGAAALGGAAGRVERLGGAQIPAQGVRLEGRREESGDGEPPVQRGENAERRRGEVAEGSGGGVRDPSGDLDGKGPPSRCSIWAEPVGVKGRGANYVAPCRHRLRADRRAQAGSDRRRRYTLPLHGVQEAVGHRADVRRPDRRGAQDPRREPGATGRPPGSTGRSAPPDFLPRSYSDTVDAADRIESVPRGRPTESGAARPGCFRPCAAWNYAPGCPVRRP